MKVSLNWLKEYVNIDIQSDALANRFNLMSAEVESLEKLVNATNLVVGHVLTCELHPDSDHLHVCTVDVGNEVLQIVCGAPNVAAGQKVIVALEGAVLPGNFKIKKSKIRGVESIGMICSLDELGIDHKYHMEDGIHILADDLSAGSDPLKALSLDDEVIDLDLTPNRGDLLSVLGVAYDVSAMLGTALHIDEPSVTEIEEKNPVKVSTRTEGCMSYYARVIKNITIHESPDWLKGRLIASGIRPINNVVDVTNYVMLEYGQPLHAFDYHLVKTDTIVVRDGIQGETITTLDGKIRQLTEEDLVITDGSRPICLAGVMGGIDTEITDNTTAILLESATFDPIRIRKTSKRLDLRSEASMRYERKLDPNRTILALNRACQLFELLANGKVLSGTVSFDHNTLIPKPINFSVAQINKVTGYQYKVSDLEDVFNRLHFNFLVTGESFIVDAPTRRQDLSTYQDLIEEVVRIHGYQFIPTSIPKVPSNGYLTEEQQFRRQIRDTLTYLGLDEIISYSLVPQPEAVEFDLESKPVVRLSFPMSEDRSTLRHSLIPSMLDVASYNAARKAERIFLFEMGKGYTLESETEYVSGVISGVYQDSLWQGKKEPADYFVVKGFLESLFDKLGIAEVQWRVPENKFPLLHPGITAEIWAKDLKLGVIGKLHPETEKARNLSETYLFELELKAMENASHPNDHMREIAKFPAVSRDIAIVIDRTVSSEQIVERIRKAGKKSLIDVKIFDVYQGEKVDQNKKSVAFSLLFQDFSKTLETAEVDQMVNRILKTLETDFNATLRS